MPCDGASCVVRFSFIDARGVGHIAVACLSVGRKSARLCAVDPLAPSELLAVGHIRTARSVSVVPCVPVVFGFPPDERLSIPVAVGHKPEPLASMRGTNVGRAAQTPFRIEPEAGKVSEDMG